jgi:hypothetical protein
MGNVDALISPAATQDDRALLVLACVHELSPTDLHKLSVERLSRSDAARSNFPSAEICAACLVGRYAHYQGIARAAAD